MSCFLCLQKPDSAINIYEGLEEGFVILNIPNIIEKHVCFQPNKNDPMLCNKCWATIESFYIFCLHIEETHKQLNESKDNVKLDDKHQIGEYENSLSIGLQDSTCDGSESISNNMDFENAEIVSVTIEEKIEIDGNENFDDANSPKCTKSTARPKRKCSSKSVLKNKHVARKPIKANAKNVKDDDYKENSTKEKKTRMTVIRSADAVDEKISSYMTLSCDICGETAVTLAALKTHFRLIHKQKGYAMCCNRKFKKRYLLIDHIDYHLNPEHFKCELCDKTFTVAESLKKHVKDIHETEERVYVQCDECPKKFIRKSILLRHKAYHLPTESWKFPCEECGKIFPSKFYLTSHRTFSHSSLPTKICYVCGKPVPTNRYKKHMKIHDGNNEEEKVECEICNAKLNKKYINVHRQHHKEAEKEEFFCPKCNHKSPNRRALYIHTRYTHAEQRNHECHICHKTFKRKLALRQHMGTHTGNNLYSCPYCPKTFTYDSNFYIHKKKEHPQEIQIERQKQTRTNFTEHKKSFAKIVDDEVTQSANQLDAIPNSIEIDDGVDVKIEIYNTVEAFINLE